MLSKEELASRIAVLKKELDENAKQQERIKQSYKGKLNELEKSKAKKEEEKKEVSKNKPFFGFTRAGKEHSARIAQIDAEIQDIQYQIDNLYKSDEEYLALTAAYGPKYREYADLGDQMKEYTFREKLGENCVYIYTTGFLDKDRIGVVIDGKDMGTIPTPIGVYPLPEGAHSLYVTRNYGEAKTVQFRLNGNNKFLYYEFEYYGNGYKDNISNTFDEFVKDNALYDCTVGIIKNHILNF